MNSSYNKMRGGTVPMLDIKERNVIEHIVAKDALKFAFMVWLIIRVALSLWGAIVAYTVPDATYQNVAENYPDVTLPGNDISSYTITVWNIYDTPHYIDIAEKGYDSDPNYLTAFFPGFPLLIKLFSPLFFGHSLLAAIVIANVCALMFFWYFYRLVEADYGEKVAKRAVVFSAVFPTSFFLFMAYTEAPLLAFSAAALYYGRQQKWWAAGLLAGAAALVKQPGIFLILPLSYMYWRQYITYNKDVWKEGWNRRSIRHLFKRFDWAWLLLCPIAAIGYTIYRYLFIAAPIAGATDLGASEMLQVPGYPLVRAIQALRLDNPHLIPDIMEICFAVLMIALVVGTALKIRSLTYSLYSVLLALVSLSVTWPDMTRPEADIPRRALIIFPIFIYLALSTSSPRAFRYLTIISFLFFLALSGLFVNWFFVS